MDAQPKTIPNPRYCEKCEGLGYLVADAEWKPVAVQCDACKDRTVKLSVMFSEYAIRETMREHWLTGVACNKASGNNQSFCFCAVWKSGACSSPVRAAEVWTDHFIEKLSEGPSK